MDTSCPKYDIQKIFSAYNPSRPNAYAQIDVYKRQDKDINKNYLSSGSIFMNYLNNGFNDENTILFGHHMLSLIHIYTRPS